jgi:cytochrome c biogenesis protein ResB
VVTIFPVDWTVYGALIAGFLAVSGTLAFLVVRVLQAWRALKRLRRHLAKELDRLADLAEQTADKVAAATDAAELTESLTRLRVTLARFAVLREALDESTAVFARATALYPRK